jgi:hypothetical protein
MIKKLRNQNYAPKWEQEERERKKQSVIPQKLELFITTGAGSCNLDSCLVPAP